MSTLYKNNNKPLGELEDVNEKFFKEVWAEAKNLERLDEKSKVRETAAQFKHLVLRSLSKYLPHIALGIASTAALKQFIESFSYTEAASLSVAMTAILTIIIDEYNRSHSIKEGENS